MAHLSSPPRLWVPALAQRDSLSRGPVAHLPVRDPFGAPAQSLAGLGCAIRGFEKPHTDDLRWRNLALGVFRSP